MIIKSKIYFKIFSVKEVVLKQPLLLLAITQI